MSADYHKASNITTVCASCGVAEIDHVKLKECDNCDLVRYCSDECQKNHRSEHEDACKKRAAELRDEMLFKQPEGTHLEDCPICCLPLSLEMEESGMHMCCSKVICKGCDYANRTRVVKMRLRLSCPFCREPLPEPGESRKLLMKRIEANDPVAIRHEGIKHYHKRDYHSAFEYLSKAAELGDLEAHCKLACLYQMGHGVEKDKEKEIFHFEEAAIGGHPFARYVLGSMEWNNFNMDRAVKHWIIAATQGDDDAIKVLMGAFKQGYVEKEDLASALRAHKAAVDATKSPQREAAEKYRRK